MNVDSLADIQTERALLGAILLEEDTATGIDRVARIGVDASIFSDQQTREAWEALSAETAAGRKVDGVILSRLTAIALPQFESWMDLALTRAYAESYANKLVDLANRRVLAGILTQARGWLVDPSQPASFTAMEMRKSAGESPKAGAFETVAARRRSTSELSRASAWME